MNKDKFYYFYKLDFTDTEGKKYKNYDIWISDVI